MLKDASNDLEAETSSLIDKDRVRHSSNSYLPPWMRKTLIGLLLCFIGLALFDLIVLYESRSRLGINNGYLSLSGENKVDATFHLQGNFRAESYLYSADVESCQCSFNLQKEEGWTEIVHMSSTKENSQRMTLSFQHTRFHELRQSFSSVLWNSPLDLRVECTLTSSVSLFGALRVPLIIEMLTSIAAQESKAHMTMQSTTSFNGHTIHKSLQAETFERSALNLSMLLSQLLSSRKPKNGSSGESESGTTTSLVEAISTHTTWLKMCVNPFATSLASLSKVGMSSLIVTIPGLSTAISALADKPELGGVVVSTSSFDVDILQPMLTIKVNVDVKCTGDTKLSANNHHDCSFPSSDEILTYANHLFANRFHTSVDFVGKENFLTNAIGHHHALKVQFANGVNVRVPSGHSSNRRLVTENSMAIIDAASAMHNNTAPSCLLFDGDDILQVYLCTYASHGYDVFMHIVSHNETQFTGSWNNRWMGSLLHPHSFEINNDWDVFVTDDQYYSWKSIVSPSREFVLADISYVDHGESQFRFHALANWSSLSHTKEQNITARVVFKDELVTGLHSELDFAFQLEEKRQYTIHMNVGPAQIFGGGNYMLVNHSHWESRTLLHGIDADGHTLFDTDALTTVYESAQNGTIVAYNRNVTSNIWNFITDVSITNIPNRDPDHLAASGQYRMASNQWMMKVNDSLWTSNHAGNISRFGSFTGGFDLHSCYGNSTNIISVFCKLRGPKNKKMLSTNTTLAWSKPYYKASWIDMGAIEFSTEFRPYFLFVASDNSTANDTQPLALRTVNTSANNTDVANDLFTNVNGLVRIRRHIAPVISASRPHVNSISLCDSSTISLDLSYQNLTEVPDITASCPNLEILNLEGNRLVTLPDRLFNLTKLVELNLIGTGLVSLNKRINYLDHLESLYLQQNSLTSLPEEIGGLASILEIHLDDNMLTTLPESFGALYTLQLLSIQRNSLLYLPFYWYSLQNLLFVYLNNNQLTYLSEYYYWQKLRILDIRGNSLSYIPSWIFNYCPDMERLYYDGQPTFTCDSSTTYLDLSYRGFYSFTLPSFDNCTNLMYLRLNGNSLQSIPDDILALPKLEELYINNNRLQSIPSYIEALGATLRYLDLAYNQLEYLPDSIDGLTSLEYLYLSSNFLEELPFTIGALSSLKTLDLKWNRLQYLPQEIGSLSSLTYLSLEGNNLNSLPDTFGDITTLEYLYLSSNRLVTLPSSIGQLVNLQTLNLNYNYYLESVPDEITSCVSLRYWYANGNKLTSIPENIGYMTQLQYVDFSSNRITSLPSSVGQLTALTQMYLSYNQITSLPYTLGNCSSLMYLSVGQNQLSSLPESVGWLDNLMTFDAFSNQISSLPDGVCGMRALQNLYFDNNYLQSIPECIGDLTNLRYFYASGNQITLLPDSFYSLPNLFVLSLNGNHFSEVSPLIGQMTSLRNIYLSNNWLTDLPIELSSLKYTLNQMSLYSNRFTSIPLAVCNMTFLNTLDFSYNQLTYVPPAIRNMQNLNALYLYGNMLADLPMELAELPYLNTLDVSSNQFTQIPSVVYQMPSLQYLYFRFNLLQTIGTEISALTQIYYLDLSVNLITAIPVEIRNMTNLRSLSVSGNQITELPLALLLIPDLNWLDCSFNQIAVIPPEFFVRPGLYVYYYGNPAYPSYGEDDDEVSDYGIKLGNLGIFSLIANGWDLNFSLMYGNHTYNITMQENAENGATNLMINGTGAFSQHDNRRWFLSVANLELAVQESFLGSIRGFALVNKHNVSNTDVFDTFAHGLVLDKHWNTVFSVDSNSTVRAHVPHGEMCQFKGQVNTSLVNFDGHVHFDGPMYAISTDVIHGTVTTPSFLPNLCSHNTFVAVIDSPTLAPTIEPTFNPTYQPTDSLAIEPTHSPTAAPTFEPTFEPTVEPSVSPTLTPTAEPTTQPTFLPSTTAPPSVEPTFAPTAIPTVEPTFNPTFEPTFEPTLVPGETHRPSAEPTFMPSAIPTHVPSANPSVEPTFMPSAIPTEVPTYVPTVTPTAIPTAIPTSDPTYQPSAVPTKEPSTSPTFSPTYTPSATPTEVPTFAPSMTPSAQPTASPTISNVPTVAPTTRTPTMHPTAIPTVPPTVRASSAPSTIAPTLNNNAPVISSIVATSSRASITLQLTFDNSAVFAGTAICAVFAPSASITSIQQVLTVASARSKGYLAGDQSVTVELGGLAAVTAYKTYCVISTINGINSLWSNVQSTERNTTTSCCKTFSFANAPSVVYGDVSLYGANTNPNQYVFTYSLSAAPGDSVTITPLVYFTNGTIASMITATRSSLSFASNANLLTGRFVLSAPSTMSGSFRVQLVTSGNSASQYWPNISVPFSLISSATPKPAPVLTTVKFANNGGFLIALFDTATNKAVATSATFSCSQLLTFTGDSSSSCNWMNSTALRIALPGTSTVQVGDSVTLLSGLVKAECLTGQDCSAYELAPQQSATIQVPDIPLIPSVFLTTAAVVSSCDNVTMDASLSTGSGGRPWASVTWTVVRADALGLVSVPNVLSVLNNRGVNVGTPIILSRTLFSPATYTVTLTLTNFLGGSSSKTVIFALDENPNLPIVTILGPTERTMSPRDALSLFTSTVQASCAEKTSTISYRWFVLQNNVAITRPSISTVSTRYSLSPNMLSPGNVYTFVFEATASATSNTAAITGRASTTVRVVNGAVVVVVVGGYRRQVPTTGQLTIDASPSYDENLPSATQSSSLTFTWSCTISSANRFGESCDSLIPTSVTASTKILTVDASLLEAGNLYDFQVTAKATDGRSGSAVVTVQPQLGGSTTFTTINSLVEKVNAEQRVSLLGAVRATYALDCAWTASIDGINVPFASLTPSSERFTRIAVRNNFAYSLLVPGNVFTPGSYVTFRLNAHYAGNASRFPAYSEINVKINAPPSDGTFVVTPASGFALTTMFVASSSNWLDDPEDFPLTYQFLYQTSSTQPPLNLQLRSPSNRVSTNLPLGSASSNYSIIMTCTVFDVALAKTTTTLDTIVRENVVQVDVASYVTSQMSSFQNVGDVNTVGQLIATVGSTMNAVNCSLVSNAFCTSKNRGACANTPQTCSACLSGFVGLPGDANTKCIASSSARRHLMMTSTHLRSKNSMRYQSNAAGLNDVCTVDDDCILGLCDTQQGRCVAPAKRCPSDSLEVCSGHGECRFVSRAGKPWNVTTEGACDVTNPACLAQCRCADGYGGRGCVLTTERLHTQNEIRSTLCAAVVTVGNQSDPSVSLLETLIGYLETAFVPEEVTEPESVRHCRTAMRFIVDMIAENPSFVTEVTSTKLTSLFELVGAFLTVNQQVDHASSSSSSSSSAVEDVRFMRYVVSQVTSALAISMVNGQEDVSLSSSSLRTLVTRGRLTNSSSHVASPRTDDEVFYESAGALASLGMSVSSSSAAGVNDTISNHPWVDSQGYLSLSMTLWNVLQLFPNASNVLRTPMVQVENHQSNDIASSRRLQSTSENNNNDEVYTVTLPWNEPQLVSTSSVSLETAQMLDLTNVTFPFCVQFDDVQRVYTVCPHCNVTSYTSVNVTLTCLAASESATPIGVTMTTANAFASSGGGTTSPNQVVSRDTNDGNDAQVAIAVGVSVGVVLLFALIIGIYVYAKQRPSTQVVDHTQKPNNGNVQAVWQPFQAHQRQKVVPITGDV